MTVVKARKLTTRQAKFVRGLAAGKTGTQAARDAGYSAKNAGHFAGRLVQKSHIAEALAELTEKIAGPDVATAKRRQEWWTAVMEDDKQPMQFRLKAAEFLGKSQGDFVERHEVTGKDGAPLPAAQTVVVYVPENGRTA